MLRRHSPAERQRRLVELRADRFGDLFGTRIVAIEHEVRVQIAVAGMPERPDADVVAGTDLLDHHEHVGHLRARDPDVLHLHGPDALERLIREPARLPEHVRFERIVRPNEQRRSRGLAHGNRAIELRVRRLGGEVRFDQEHRGRVAIEAQVMHVVDGRDRELVEQLERDRLQAARGHARHRPAGGFERREERQQR